MPVRGRLPRLSLGPGDVRALAGYNRAVFERYLRRVARLPGRAATRRREIGHQSLFDTLVHILNVHEVWLVYLVPGRGGELEALFRTASRRPATFEGLRSYARHVFDEIDRTVASLDGRSLGRRVKAPWMPGTYTVRDAFLQTTLEQAHHLGEIIGALWQDDLEPPSMTWIDTQRGLAGRGRRRPRG